MKRDGLPKLTLSLLCDADSEGTQRDEFRLRRELEELDLDLLVSPPIEAPAGTRSADSATIGQILIALSATGGVLTSVIGVVKEHIARNPSSITIELGGDKLTISNPSDESQNKLVDAWITRHQGS